jgi:MFS family permease
MVADMLPRDKYSSGIGYYSLAQSTSFAAGPYIGLWLLDMTGFKGTFIISAFVMLLAALLTLNISENRSETRRFQISLSNIIAREAALPAFIVMIMNIGGSATSFLVVFAAGRGVRSNIGLYFLISAGGMFASRPLIGKITDRFGVVYACIPAFIATIVSYIVISGSFALRGFIIAAVIAAFGQGSCLPVIQALTMKSVPKERRGVASSTNFIGYDLGYLIGPAFAGYVAQSYSYVTMWYVMGIPFVTGIVMLFCLRKRISDIEKRFDAG